MKRIYLDHAATTPVHPEVGEAMLPYLTERFGNASTLYSFGREAKEALEEAREKVASLIGANPQEVFFTSGGTESDNWALIGVMFARERKGRHLITSAIEHHAVLETCRFLERRGFEVTYLPVDADGLVDPEEVKKALRPDTVLVSIMHANNEIGTIEPLEEIGEMLQQREVLFHTDAVQTVGSIPVDVKALQVNLLSLSGHKLYGPKGVGALYIRRGTRIWPFIHGGGQERNRRAGTENVAGIVGLGKACELAAVDLEERAERLKQLREQLIEGLFARIEDIRLNGHRTRRLPNNVNICVEGVEGESMLLMLDWEGIAVSTGSACSSGSLEPSHVLEAIGVPPAIAQGSLRFTFGRENSEEDVERVLEVLPPIVTRLREMSPLR
ncbi:MAG TPA: cysteine desulfurase NifS [Armatimonadetes bacterium]|nr:cysteine desulfurase NifS [Armatimonadota bacterium]